MRTRLSAVGDEVAPDISQPGGAEISDQVVQARRLWASGNFGSGSAGLGNMRTRKSHRTELTCAPWALPGETRVRQVFLPSGQQGQPGECLPLRTVSSMRHPTAVGDCATRPCCQPKPGKMQQTSCHANVTASAEVPQAPDLQLACLNVFGSSPFLRSSRYRVPRGTPASRDTLVTSPFHVLSSTVKYSFSKARIRCSRMAKSASGSSCQAGYRRRRHSRPVVSRRHFPRTGTCCSRTREQ